MTKWYDFKFAIQAWKDHLMRGGAGAIPIFSSTKKKKKKKKKKPYSSGVIPIFFSFIATVHIYRLRAKK